MKTSEEGTAVNRPNGVRQGACEGAILFLFIMHAALQKMKWPVARPAFRTRAERVKSGEGSNRKHGVTPFELFASLFASDCATFFETREDMVTEAPFTMPCTATLCDSGPCS